MESKICLDTDVVVNFLRGNKQEAEFIRSKEESADLAITYITLFELYYGAYKSSKKSIIFVLQAIWGKKIDGRCP